MVETERAMAACDPAIARILEKVLSGGEVSVAEGELLFTVTGAELAATVATADHIRRQKVGDRVT